MSTTSNATHDTGGPDGAPAKPTQAQAQATAAAASAAADAAAAGAAAALPHSDKVAAALLRMQASRALLRSVMVPPPKPDDSAGRKQRTSGAGFKVGEFGRLLWRQVRGQWRHSPSLQVATHAVQTWWRKQPWYGAASLAGNELRGVIVPVVRRNPWSAVAGAAAVGAAVMAVRPWRWSLVSGQWRTLRAEMLGAVRTQVFHIPLQMALASLMSVLVAHAQGGDEDDTANAGSTDADGSADAAADLAADLAADVPLDHGTGAGTGAAPPGREPGATH